MVVGILCALATLPAHATPPICTDQHGAVSRCVSADALRRCDADSTQLPLVWRSFSAERAERIRLTNVVVPQLGRDNAALVAALNTARRELASEKRWGPRWAWMSVGAVGVLVLGAIVTVVLVIAQ